MPYRVRTEDGKTFIYPYHGGYAWGNAPEYRWNSEKAAIEAVRTNQPYSDQRLIVEKAA